MLHSSQYPNITVAASSAVSAKANTSVVSICQPHARTLKCPASRASNHPINANGTVNAKNGEQLVQATLNTLHGGPATAQRKTQQGQSHEGQPFTQTVYSADNTVVAEHWLLHGAGHAWSGGHPGGSHTDARGVDATGEMLRFFLEHPHAR